MSTRLFLFLFLTALISCCGAEPEKGLNVLDNPSFEEKGEQGSAIAGWKLGSKTLSRDESTAHSGTASLKYASTNAKARGAATQEVTAEPGANYTLSAWVKTRNLKGSARFALEFYSDARVFSKKTFLGGAYPPAVKGTHDWTPVKQRVHIPERSKFALLTLAADSEGAAWFDDVKLQRFKYPPMRTVLVSPHYRGWLIAGKEQTIRVRARLNTAEHDFRPEDVQLVARVKTKDSTLLKEIRTRPESEMVEISLALDSPLKPGALVVRLSLEDLRAGGKVLDTKEHAIKVLDKEIIPAVTFDKHRRMIVDGKPFFPLGMCLMSLNENDLRIYAQSRFNYVLPLASPKKSHMDMAHKHGLKVMYNIMNFFGKEAAEHESLTRDHVRKFRDHPALLAWFMADEPASHRIPPAKVRAQQRWVEEEDPNHPTLLTMMHPERVYEYINGCDAISTDPYPIPQNPASMAGKWTRETVSQVLNARPVWMVPQMFNFAAYPQNRSTHRTPTLQEMRCMAWQCVCEGAKGLCFYSFFDLKRDPQTPFETQWPRCKKVAAEIADMTPVLLSIAPDVQVKVEAPGWLHWLAKSHKGKLYIMAVNDGDGEGEATFRLPGIPQSIKVRGENRTITPHGATFSDRFEKLNVHIYEVEQGDDG